MVNWFTSLVLAEQKLNQNIWYERIRGPAIAWFSIPPESQESVASISGIHTYRSLCVIEKYGLGQGQRLNCDLFNVHSYLAETPVLKKSYWCRVADSGNNLYRYCGVRSGLVKCDWKIWWIYFTCQNLSPLGKTAPGLRGLLEDYEFLEVGAGAQAPALAEYEAGIHEKHVQQTPQTPKVRKRNPI